MNARDTLTPEQRATLAAHIGDAKPARTALVVQFGESVRDCREHAHEKQGEDWFCLNLTAYMGERMAPVLRRLLDAEAEIERLRTDRAEVLREAEAAIAALPQDYECDPGRGDARELLRRMAEGAGQDGKDTRDGSQPTEDESTQPETDEWIRCSHIHCPNAEWFAKAPERGWQHGHMDTWLCPEHRTEPRRVQCAHGRYLQHTCPACQIGTHA